MTCSACSEKLLPLRFEKLLPQRFCFCETLDRGVFIVGSVGLVLSIIGFLRSVTAGDQSNIGYYELIIGSIIVLIANIFLIVAAKTRRRGFCWPYMILYPIAVVLMIINFIGSVVALDGATGVISIIVIGLEIYFLLVVVSFYRALCGTPVSSA